MDNLLVYTNGVEASAENAVSTANQIGKAMANNSLSSLTRSGITVTDDEEKQFKALTSEEEKAALLAEIITNNVGEMNTALANTPAGQQQQLANAWGDMKENVGNKVYPAIMDLFSAINANMPVIETFVNGFATGMYYIIEVLTVIIDVVGTIGSFISDNWSIIGPIIMGIVTALTIYYGVLLIVKAATTAWSAVQKVFNAIMSMNPVMLVVIAIILLVAMIYAVIGAINKWTGSTISATGVICGCINVVLQFFKNLGLTVANIALGIWNALCACASNVGTAFHNAICGIQSWFYSLLSTVLTVVAKVCEALNKIPFVSIDYAGITSKADEYAAKASEAANNKEEYTSVSDAFNSGMSTFDTWENGWASDAYNGGYSFGEGLENSVGSLFSMDSLDLDSITGLNSLSNSDASNMANNIADTANNTSEIADSMDITEEDLKYLRDIAEQEVINRFTTAEINVEMNNNNNINSESDLDGIVSGLEDKIYEMVISMAEGVHS
jgi:hypothetical protein